MHKLQDYNSYIMLLLCHWLNIFFLHEILNLFIKPSSFWLMTGRVYCFHQIKKKIIFGKDSIISPSLFLQTLLVHSPFLANIWQAELLATSCFFVYPVSLFSHTPAHQHISVPFVWCDSLMKLDEQGKFASQLKRYSMF